jgi:hypothetical protein
MQLVGRLAGLEFPATEHVPLEDPIRIVRWMDETLRQRRTPHLTTAVSAAIRLSECALAAGIDLSGAQLTVGNEPLTRARLDAIERCGAHAVPAYGAVDGPGLAVFCLAPQEADEFHLQHDICAMIQPGLEGATDELPPNALLVSSLHRSTRYVEINLSLGDQAVMTQRDCGCAIGDLGLHTHLHSVRSFEKLTAVGMTFLDSDIIPVLEEVLPGRFGGAPTHYQIVETEGRNGAPQVTLLIHPCVGQVNEREAADAFLSSIGQRSSTARMMELTWRSAGLPLVERRPPMATAGGKILHVHVDDGRMLAGARVAATS